MKVIICGGRKLTKMQVLLDALKALHEVMPAEITDVIHGDAQGADHLADLWAETHSVDRLKVPANWNRYGPPAGAIRNRRMLTFEPDLVLALWDGQSKGTASMIREAKKAGVPVAVYRYDLQELTEAPEKNYP
jgi:hypothetical protein